MRNEMKSAPGRKKTSSYIPQDMKITNIRGLSADTKAYRLEFSSKNEAKNFSFEPGQFAIISIPGYGESAVGITTAPHELPSLEIAVRGVGNTTMALNRLKVGGEIGLRGPYGNPFPKDLIAGKEVLIIAGGLGLAPLRSLIHKNGLEKLPENNLKIFIGAVNPESLIYKDELKKWEKFAEVSIIVDRADGDWNGNVGRVTDLIEKTEIDKNAIAIICGPPVMFKPVIDKLKNAGLKNKQIFVLLERRMKCGIGKCQHCTCGDKYVCLDGPTFCWEDVIDNWEALV